jgi:hypothetical protein
MPKLFNNRRILVFSVFMILSIGGFFYYWNNQKEVKAINEGLPEGISVVKTITNEYKLKNDVDGYEFKIPKEWAGISEIFYTPKRTESGYKMATIELAGNNSSSIVLVINQFENDGEELIDWVNNNFNTFGLVGNFSEDNINGIKVVKTTEEIHLLGMWVYFFKMDEFVYAITNGSEDYIEYIIANGKW